MIGTVIRPSGPNAKPSPDLSPHVARLSVEAARSSANDRTVNVDADRRLAVAASLADVLKRPNPARIDFLAASPRVIDRSGNSKTLIGMIEQEVCVDRSSQAEKSAETGRPKR